MAVFYDTHQLQMSSYRSLLCIGLSALFLLALPACRNQANSHISFELGGSCDACPANRLDTLLLLTQGVVTVTYDTLSHHLQLGYDSTRISSPVIISLLNDAGYDVDESYALLPTLLDPCCQVSEVEQDSAFMTDADALGSFQELLGEENSDAGDSLDDATLTRELRGVLEADLLHGVHELDLEQELDIDLEDGEDTPQGGGKP
jgi:hypothetical protein